MIKWPVTYTTYDGNTITEDFYFNLSKPELVQMQLDNNGSYVSFLNRIQNERDMGAIGHEFQRLILQSFGKKSDDGKHFRKSKEMSEEFSQSAAYEALFMDLFQDGEKSAAFFKGILPNDIIEKIDEAEKAGTLPQLVGSE